MSISGAIARWNDTIRGCNAAPVADGPLPSDSQVIGAVLRQMPERAVIVCAPEDFRVSCIAIGARARLVGLSR